MITKFFKKGDCTLFILTQIEEIKIIAHKTKAAVIGISESKLDETVLNGEILIPGIKFLGLTEIETEAGFCVT